MKQPLRCISLICSDMRTFPIKVHYKVIEILAVRRLGTKLMLLETTKERRKHKLNIVLEGW